MHQRITLWSILFIITLITQKNTAYASAIVDPVLVKFAQTATPNQKTKVIVLLQVPNQQIQSPHRYRRVEVLRYLQQIMAAAIDHLRVEFPNTEELHDDIEVTETFWINLSLGAIVNTKGLDRLIRSPSVKAVYANRAVHFPIGPRTHRFIENAATLPYNYSSTGLDRLLKEMPELDGRGVLMGHIDTGVDGKHPLLQGKILAFFDGKKIVPQATDADTHGTHTAGTMVGGDRQKNFIGVAPGAKLLSAGYLQSMDQVLKGMQWMLDPDGNPQTNDSPKLVSNSWGLVPGDDEEATYRAVASWEAAGIIPVFSAGNMGPNDKSIGAPANHPDVVSVAATGPSQKVAGFSSRGPALFSGKEIQKPDLSAPGVDVVSSVPSGGVEKMSGTSMAAPHVAGAIALMFQANPNLTPPQVKDILRASAVAVDSRGGNIPTKLWNKLYGFGRLDIYKAVQMARSVTARMALHDAFSEILDPRHLHHLQEEYFEMK